MASAPRQVLNRDPRPGWTPLALAAVAATTLTAGLAVAGEWSCLPAPLPGETAHALALAADQALAAWRGDGPATSCFTGSSAGIAMKAAAGLLADVLPAAFALALLCQLAGAQLRRRWIALRGGHVLALLAPVDRADALRDSTAPLILLDTGGAPHERAGLLLPEAGDAARDLLDAAGLLRARECLLAGDDDASNLRIARLCLDLLAADPGSRPRLDVRVEDGLLADGAGPELRRRAREIGIELTVFAARRNRIRRGLALATPARVRTVPEGPVHTVVFGAGPLLREIAGTLARRGQGLDHDQPVLTILALTSDDLPVPDLARLERSALADVRVAHPDAQDLLGVDGEISHLLVERPTVRSVHLCSPRPGRVEALAERWRRQCRQLGVPCPRLVLYEDGVAAGGPRPGADVSTVVIPRIPMLDARTVARRMDRRARELHDTYIEGARARLGDAFGARPAEREWDELPTQFREENQEAADGFEFLLETVDIDVLPGPAGPLDARDDEIERIARAEHARWMASRWFLGWRHGETRDDDALLHPDLVPYDDLSEATREKDRDNARNAVRLLQEEGARLARWALVHPSSPGGATNAGAVHPLLAVPAAEAGDATVLRRATDAGWGLAWLDHGVALPDARGLVEDDALLAARLFLFPDGAAACADWLDAHATGDGGHADADA